MSQTMTVIPSHSSHSSKCNALEPFGAQPQEYVVCLFDRGQNRYWDIEMKRNRKKGYSIGRQAANQVSHRGVLGFESHHVIMPRYSWFSASPGMRYPSREAKHEIIHKYHDSQQTKPIPPWFLDSNDSMPSSHPLISTIPFRVKPRTTSQFYPSLLLFLEAWQQLLAQQHFEYLQTSLEDPAGAGWAGRHLGRFAHVAWSFAHH